MMKSKLREMHRRVVKVRPPVMRRLEAGSPLLEPMDDPWWIDSQFVSDPVVVQLHNPATGHVIDLFSDGVQEFRYPDQLILKEQLTLTFRGVLREALPDRRMAYRAGYEATED